MLIVAWIVVGFLVGTLAQNILVASTERFMSDLVVGIAGALAAGWAANGFAIRLLEFNLYSVLAASAGAGLSIVIFRRARRGRHGRRGAWGART
jgi:uncharacterized membrane protein YeaQ/YmgE (transglycosylase-associated protein family)